MAYQQKVNTVWEIGKLHHKQYATLSIIKTFAEDWRAAAWQNVDYKTKIHI